MKDTNRIKEDQRRSNSNSDLRNRFETLQELDDIDTISETITDMCGNQQATEIEDIVTNKSPDGETAGNGGKWRR